MGFLNKDVFVCLDLETTGLLPDEDRIIEVAAVRFTFGETLDSIETLIDPQVSIPSSSTDIHHITTEMVMGKPKIEEVLPSIIEFIGDSIIVGHGIPLDIAFLIAAAKRANIRNNLTNHPFLDTLRMARLYGESPINSLEKLRQHFNIAAEGAHRAMSDVIVNVEVFKYLAKGYNTTQQLMERLTRPIPLKKMPLGKHKGRPFTEIPMEYLQWAANKDFDQDLMHSIISEIKRRKKGNLFGQASNPFSAL